MIRTRWYVTVLNPSLQENVGMLVSINRTSTQCPIVIISVIM